MLIKIPLEVIEKSLKKACEEYDVSNNEAIKLKLEGYFCS